MSPISLHLCDFVLERTGKMGALEYLSTFCAVTGIRNKRKPMQTVEIKVKIDCDGCERRVKNAVRTMKGVKSVEVNRKLSRVTVSGYVDPNRVLKRVKSTGKRAAEFWPYIPQHIVHYPHASGVYDKRAPAGFVRNVVQAFPARSDAPEDNVITFFSDDNVNACSIM